MIGRFQIPRLFSSASVKLSALYLLLFAVSACVLGLAVFLETQAALQQQMAARIETETAFVSGEFRRGGVDRLVEVVKARGHGPSALDYLVQRTDGTHLVGEIPTQADLEPGWRTIRVANAIEDGGGPESVRALVTQLSEGVLLVVGDDLAQNGEVEEAIGTAFGWAVGLALLLGVGGGVLLSRAFLRRVDAIGSTATAIIGGDLARRIPVGGADDDLDRLAATLNRMLDRIGGLMDNLRQVSSDVAHDLRTPLSRLYLGLGEARSSARSVRDYERAVDAALAEAEGLLATFSALLRIAEVEATARQEGFADVDLSALAEGVAHAYRPDAEEEGQRLDAPITSGVRIRGDKELLTQALANLVENAMRHTPAGTRIEVGLETGPPGPILSVSDDGPGVTEADLPRLTQRFYRGERSRTTAGNGLGLSLVAAVAEMHGAILSIKPARPGLRIAMRFRP